MQRETTIIELGKKVYTFVHTPFDAEVDRDDLTFIHYDNLMGEIITVPTLMNRVGILKAEADNALNQTKLAHRILEATKSEHYRKALIVKSQEKTKHPTVGAVEDAVILDEEVSSSKRNYYKVMKEAEIMDSLYWAVKAKQQKLNHISQSITPADFEKEVLEGTINGILIQSRNKAF